MSTKKDTIQYVIQEEGFKYHTRKCVLMKGSIVSKDIHPVNEVEQLKKELIKAKRLSDKHTHYICKKNIRTGALMAYNLHQGHLVSELPQFTITINGRPGEDTNIKEAFKLGSNVFSADNDYPRLIEKDCFKVRKIIKGSLCKDFFEREHGENFSIIELFVTEVLESVGVLKNYRRGDAKKKECDIVDEDKQCQIEIVRFFDEKISDKVRYNRKPDSEEQALLFEYCDIGYNRVPRGVLNKFTKKTYSNKYPKELAIYTIGSLEQALRKVEKLLEELDQKEDFSTEYEQIHIIVHDPLIKEEVYYCSRGREVFISDHQFAYSPLIGRTTVQLDEMLDEEKYFVIKDNLFCDVTQIMWMKGEDIRKVFHLI